MLCPECQRWSGWTSTIRPIRSRIVRVLPGYRWKPPFHDELGRLHLHYGCADTEIILNCSRGHRWVEHYKGSCWCGWPDKGEYAEETE